MKVTDSVQDCEAEFSSLMEDEYRFSTPSARLTHWEGLKRYCSRDEQYEVRRGYLYVQAGDLATADAILKAALPIASKYRRYVEYNLFDIKLLKNEFADAEERARQLINSYPQWGGGYSALGQVFLVSGKFKEGIPYFLKSNALLEQGEDARFEVGNYLRLAVAFYNVGEFKKSVISMQAALRLSPKGLRHATAACATAASLEEIGEIEAARELLVKHLELNPGGRADPFCSRVIAAFNI